MRSAGYATAALGKWQVFLDTYAKIDDPMPGAPWNRGGMDYYFGNPRGSNGGGYVSASNANWEFDRHGILTGAASEKVRVAPSSQRGLTSKTLKSADLATREGLYRENLLTDKAIQFIDVMDGKDKPYLSCRA
ncbi:MAG: sulfatase-like hydrolase/transferase [Pirellulaceae bacterium]|nr:sulfatase-like hydrolase/transferase [Pirellulaceae bacterium]